MRAHQLQQSGGTRWQVGIHQTIIQAVIQAHQTECRDRPPQIKSPNTSPRSHHKLLNVVIALQGHNDE